MKIELTGGSRSVHSKIDVQNFTIFKTLELEFTKGINVLVGTNGTGKTHLLKSMYAICEGIGIEHKANFEIAQPYFLVSACVEFDER